MKKWISKNWALIGFVLSFALDQIFGILEGLVGSDISVFIHGLGAIVLAYYWKNETTLKIGGGGIKNPKKP